MKYTNLTYIQMIAKTEYLRNSDQPGLLRLLSGSAENPLSPTDGPSFVGVATIKGCCTTAVSSVADLEGPDCCERLT